MLALPARSTARTYSGRLTFEVSPGLDGHSVMGTVAVPSAPAATHIVVELWLKP